MKTVRGVIIFITILVFVAAVSFGKDFLFLTSVHPDFDRNLFGTVSLRTCMGSRAYDVKYIINEHSQDYIWMPIDDIVDIASWKKLSDNNSAVANYEDANHLYDIHCMSDVFVTCRKKCL